MDQPGPFSPLPQQRPPEPPPKWSLKSLGGGIAAVAIGALKYGFLAVKSLKTGLSMFIMIWVYSWLFGWPFATGFVFLFFVHEMGHVVVAKMVGVPVSLPMFIPFVGAYTALKQSPQDAWTEALISCGGPVAGGIGSAFCLVAGIHWQLPWLIAVASASFVLNIINMIPVPPLDGGGICAAVSTWFWFVGLLLLGLALVYFHSWYTSLFIIFIVFFATLPRLRQTFFEPPSEELELYYHTHISNRLMMAVAYLGILAGLLAGYGHASGYLTSVLDQN